MKVPATYHTVLGPDPVTINLEAIDGTDLLAWLRVSGKAANVRVSINLATAEKLHDQFGRMLTLARRELRSVRPRRERPVPVEAGT